MQRRVRRVARRRRVRRKAARRARGPRSIRNPHRATKPRRPTQKQLRCTEDSSLHLAKGITEPPHLSIEKDDTILDDHCERLLDNLRKGPVNKKWYAGFTRRPPRKVSLPVAIGVRYGLQYDVAGDRSQRQEMSRTVAVFEWMFPYVRCMGWA